MCGCHVVMPFSVVQLVLRAVHVQEYLLAAGPTCCTCSGTLACRCMLQQLVLVGQHQFASIPYTGGYYVSVPGT